MLTNVPRKYFRETGAASQRTRTTGSHLHRTGSACARTITSNAKPPTGFYPSRLLDVENLQSPKLVYRDEIAKTGDPYVVLSYVWGPAVWSPDQVYGYTLTTLSQEQLRVGLDTVLLPKALKVSVEVTAKLGFRYLWIDAPCILQDVPEDLAVELAQMATIYKHAAATIVAASSPSLDRGFLLPPQGLHPDDRGTSFHLGDTTIQPFLNEPILSRAWCLQEDIMSYRRLFFTTESISWHYMECIIDYNGIGEPYLPPFLSFCRAATKSECDSNEIYARWVNIRTEYCARILTYAGDKLNAISAVASEVARTTVWTYLAGLWRECLADDLLCVAGGDICSIYEPRARRPFEFEVLDCQVELGGRDPFGSVKWGYLDVQGKVVELGFRRVFSLERMEYADLELRSGAIATGSGEEGGLEDHEENDIVAYGVADPLDAPLSPNVRPLCLAVAEVLFREEIEGIMLLQDGDNGFRRVGYFCAYRPAIFQDVLQRVLRIS
ncbi:heterokaryon incompatibility protein-domain-containing protein [Aspergillus pseudoustus]|uniref:Heterokaryon incompatibility protein-domain-containing protein n=1 Tax=Aspergillus pseudoustus TaxID=1810923 RepID=A0ABR4JDB4_9EURO